VNAISELLDYKIEIKERDHAVDAIRYGIPLSSQVDVEPAWEFGD
jgi:hypothetical protein